jgi:hypothetical protein
MKAVVAVILSCVCLLDAQRVSLDNFSLQEQRLGLSNSVYASERGQSLELQYKYVS